MYLGVSVCGYPHASVGTGRDRDVRFLELELLELWTVTNLPIWVLGTELKPFIRAICASNLLGSPYIDSLAN